jgi:hypothetical protein
MYKKHLATCLILSLLTGCSSLIPVGFVTTKTITGSNLNGEGKVKTENKVKEIINPQISGQITFDNDTVTFELNLPKGRFKTKALDTDSIKFFRVSLTDSKGRTYLPGNLIHDPDPAKDNLVAPVDGLIKVSFKNVIFDSAIVATVVGFDESKIEIPGTELSTAFIFNGGSKKIEFCFRNTPTGQVIDKLFDIGTTKSINVAKAVLKLDALQNFIDLLTGVTGKFPDYVYTTHPSLIDIDKIVADLLANGGNASILNPANPAYKIEPTNVSGTIEGLVSTDMVSVQIADPMSQILIGLSNGAFDNDVIPGIWQTIISVDEGAGTTYTSTSPISTDATNNINIGNITLTPALPTIISLTQAAGKKDDEIIIAGTNFHLNIDGNVVKFGTVTATVNSVTSNSELKVKVPDGIFGTEKVTVSVGTQTSNEADFEVTPVITTLDASGTIGSIITINGTGFDFNNKDNNIVTIGGQPASVNTATNNELKVFVPASVFGNVNVTVQVGNQTSNTKTFDVTPKITSLSPSDMDVGGSVKINGTGFDYVTNTNNIVKFGSTKVTPVTVNGNGTQLTITAPNVANNNVTVQVGNQTSNGSPYFILPKITLGTPPGATSSNTYNGTVALSATVTSPNDITKVEFFESGVSIGLGTETSPGSKIYNFNWDTLVPNPDETGPQILTAKVTDIANKEVTSIPLNITLDQVPVVNSINASEDPVPGLSHTIELTANVTDDGTITSYTWKTLGGNFGTFSDPAGNKILWTAPGISGEPYLIEVSAGDAINTGTGTVNITVTDGTATVNVSGGSH